MSRSGKQSPALESREVHLWYSRPDQVTDDEHVAELLRLLSQDELVRYRRFWFDKDRHHFLVAHALVRTTLSRYADIPPSGWQFEMN